MFSTLPTVKPGVPASTMMADIPFSPAAGFVRANTTSTPARLPPEMKHLVPLSTYSLVSVSRMAVVWARAASLPAPGSVRAKAPSSPPLVRRGRYFCFWASVPYLAMAWGAMRWMDRVAAEAMHFLANSDTAMTSSVMPPPTPPYSLGTPMPVKP